MAAVVGALAAVEVGLRLVRGVPWYERIVSAQNRQRPSFHAIGADSFKLRSPPPREPKSADAFRVLFLGDSFTYGQGVADASLVFPSLVVDELNRRQPLDSPRSYEMFNGGIPGSYPPRWVTLFDTVADDYEPDLVVATFFLRDGAPGEGSLHHIREVRRGMKRLAKESLVFRLSYTYRYFREEGEQRALASRYIDSMRVAYLGDADQTATWVSAQESVLQLRDRAHARGAPFALVIFPILFELTEEYPLRDVCDEIERFASANEIPVLQLLPSYLGSSAPELWVSPLDQHPNALAHGIAAPPVADLVCAVLEQEQDGPVRLMHYTPPDAAER